MNEMGGTCSTHEGYQKCTERKLILRKPLRRKDTSRLLVEVWSRVGYCEHHVVLQGSMTFFDHYKNYQLLKKVFVC
jgi:hypothetical protein